MNMPITPAIKAGAFLPFVLLLSACETSTGFLIPTTDEDKARREVELAAACLAVEEAMTEATLRQDAIPTRQWTLIQGYQRRADARCVREGIVTGADVLAVSVYAAQIARLTVDGLRD